MNTLTVSIAVYNPDLEMFKNMLKSLKLYTPELSQLMVFINSDNYQEIMDIVNIYFADIVLFQKIGINIGFGKAHNKNLEKTTGKYFAVLNDDIEFFNIWSTQMIEVLENDSSVAQVVPKTGVCNTWNEEGYGCGIETDNPEYAEGSCCMMRTELMKEFGLYSDDYAFAYWEDGDLSLRLRKADYKIKNVDVNWIHHRAVTSSKINIDIQGYHTKNEYVFKSKWNSYLMKKRFGEFIVIKRTASIGDVFLITPIIAALKEKYPDSVIVLLTQNPQAIINNADIDYIIENVHIPIPCSMFINLDEAYERDFRINIVDAYAKVAGVELNGRKTGIAFIHKKQIKIIDEIIPKDFGKFIVVEVGTTWPEKKWPYENYKELIRQIRDDGTKVAIVGIKSRFNKGEDFIEADLDLINVLDVPLTTYLLYRASMYIGHEGLLLHLAQAVRTPSVGLYGCTLPEFCNDINSKILYPVITKAACKGCRHRYMAGRMVVCNRNAECMRMISIAKVYEAYKIMKETFGLEKKTDENILCASRY